jgi:hypothetical protein
MEQIEFIPVRGTIHVELFDVYGVLKHEEYQDNLIVTVGKNGITDQLVAAPGISKPGWMELGTGVTAPAAGDTTLQTVIAASRVALTTKTRAANVLTMVGNWPAGTATNGAITEAGVFDAAAAGNMYSRATFTAIPKGASDTLQITWTYTIG